ncbi:protein BIG GRAIN 1-like B [Camellia sinensis]|uniref:protein BIG GRAIN 1-like B n=1 Tax=Camellia sinensis TaxID=4442 RepID=UPI0010360911|nr:protein BIG GRAIN 1-like B [Camellia sinensis]
MYPTFATSILNKIYRSIDGGNEKCHELKFYNDRVIKKQSHGSSVMDEDMASLCRACLLETEKLRTFCFTAKRPKPVKTTHVSKKMGNLNNEDGNGNSKKTKNSSSSSTRGYGDARVERKAKSTQASTCSWPSSYFRLCLSRTSMNSKGKPNNGVKKTVTFNPVSVIVDENGRPCGYKCIYGNSPGKYGMEELNRWQVLVEKSRKIEEAAAAREILKRYAKNAMVLRNENASGNEDDYDDVASDSSSDLFEVDHLAFTRNNNSRFCEEFPVYGTGLIR